MIGYRISGGFAARMCGVALPLRNACYLRLTATPPIWGVAPKERSSGFNGEAQPHRTSKRQSRKTSITNYCMVLTQPIDVQHRFDSGINKHNIINLDMDEIISKKESRVLRFYRWLHALPVWQNALIASAVWLWVFTVLADIHSLRMCALYQFNYVLGDSILIELYAAALGGGCLLFTICGGFILPISFSGWGIHHIFNYLKYRRQQYSFFIQITEYFGWLIVLIVTVILPFAFFYIIECAFTFSLTPFLTPVCALLWLISAKFLTKSLSQEKRAIVVCGMIILILSLRYLDFNSRKPFLRDLGKISVGMTGHEVEAIMGKYDNQMTLYTPRDYQYLESDFSEQVSYRHTDEGWGNADIGTVKFQNGQVVGVDFSHD